MKRSPFQRQDRSKSRSPRHSPRSTSSPAAPRDVVFDSVFEHAEVLREPSSPSNVKTSLKWASIGIMRKIEDKVLDLCFSKSSSIRSCPEPDPPQSLRPVQEGVSRSISDPRQNRSCSVRTQLEEANVHNAHGHRHHDLQAEHQRREKKRPNINYFRSPIDETPEMQTNWVEHRAAVSCSGQERLLQESSLPPPAEDPQRRMILNLRMFGG
mmetsp:Transcript_133370/g.231657  ORF Transcript_133370/g.231657 Transcript_133370/m.231657 type:complete len:211 (+) Transcript_133370:129-761(+)